MALAQNNAGAVGDPHGPAVLVDEFLGLDQQFLPLFCVHRNCSFLDGGIVVGIGPMTAVPVLPGAEPVEDHGRINGAGGKGEVKVKIPLAGHLVEHVRGLDVKVNMDTDAAQVFPEDFTGNVVVFRRH